MEKVREIDRQRKRKKKKEKVKEKMKETETQTEQQCFCASNTGEIFIRLGLLNINRHSILKENY